MMPKPSLHFIAGLNFELTYQCNYTCEHCLQDSLRKQYAPQWLDHQVVQKAIIDAVQLNWLKAGVNFTGGEIFHRQSPLPALLDFCYAQGLNVRVNTNGWWGNRQAIRLGERSFKDAADLIQWLKPRIAILALSFDARYDKNPQALPPVLSILRLAQEHQLPVQMNLTGPDPEVLGLQFLNLLQEQRISRQGIEPLGIETVDIGGAAQTQNPLSYAFSKKAYCEGRGFYRPFFLHINPEGGVRSCMYAPQGAWLGNVYQDSLIEIAERFADNAIVQAFSTQTPHTLVQNLKTEHSQSIPYHPCSQLALVARQIEQTQKNPNDSDWVFKELGYSSDPI